MIIWMYVDHPWSQSWVSPLCSGTLLQLPYTCIFLFLSVRVSLRKKWSQEKSTENPSDILRFPFFIRDSLRAHRRYGPNFSLRDAFFFILFREKKYKNSEPVTCAWASTVPFHAVSQYIHNHTQLKKKEHIESFSQVDVTRSTFFAGKNKNKKKCGTFFSKNHERAQGFSGSTMDRSEHDGNERAWCTELVL